MKPVVYGSEQAAKATMIIKLQFDFYIIFILCFYEGYKATVSFQIVLITCVDVCALCVSVSASVRGGRAVYKYLLKARTVYGAVAPGPNTKFNFYRIYASIVWYLIAGQIQRTRTTNAPLTFNIQTLTFKLQTEQRKKQNRRPNCLHLFINVNTFLLFLFVLSVSFSPPNRWASHAAHNSRLVHFRSFSSFMCLVRCVRDAVVNAWRQPITNAQLLIQIFWQPKIISTTHIHLSRARKPNSFAAFLFMTLTESTKYQLPGYTRYVVRGKRKTLDGVS